MGDGMIIFPYKRDESPGLHPSVKWDFKVFNYIAHKTTPMESVQSLPCYCPPQAPSPCPQVPPSPIFPLPNLRYGSMPLLLWRVVFLTFGFDVNIFTLNACHIYIYTFTAYYVWLKSLASF